LVAGAAGSPSLASTGIVSSATSPSHDATSCFMRWCKRAMSLRLASSTRCRLSFLRAAVHWRPPRSRPRASFSMVCAQPWASATWDSAARSTRPRAASQSARCIVCANSSRWVPSSNRRAAMRSYTLRALGLGATGAGAAGAGASAGAAPPSSAQARA
jgi:hypothetical protein